MNKNRKHAAQDSRNKNPKETKCSNPRSRKPNSIKSKDSEDSRKEYASHAYNDMSWYTRNPLLLESACRIPFAYPCGKYIDAGTVFESDGSKPYKGQKSVASAGVISLDYVPSIGNTDDGLSAPINIAAREMYAKIRKAYSGTLICDAPDIMLYMLSLDGIFSYIAYLKRIYRLLDIYSGNNKYVVEGIFAAMGFTSAEMNSLRSDKMQLWGIINTFIADANKWSCPAQFDILNRHYWMNDNVYLDKVNSKAQMYVFNPKGFYKFGLDGDSKGRVTVEYPEQHNISGLTAFGRDLLNTLSNSEDAYTINGYLARAFEGVPNFRVADLGIGDKQEFVFSEEVLNQIHNATIAPVGLEACTVTQDGNTGVLKASYERSIPFTASTRGVICSNLELFDSTMEVPDAINIVVGSRLHATVEAASAGSNIKYIVNAGTEIITAMNVYRINVDSVYPSNPFFVHTFTQNFVSIVKTNDVKGLSLISQFDWSPIMAVSLWDQQYSESGPFELFGDVTNLTTVTNKTMDNLHRMCIYSEFNAFGIDT